MYHTYDNSVKLLEVIIGSLFILELHSTLFFFLKAKLKMQHNEKRKPAWEE